MLRVSTHLWLKFFVSIAATGLAVFLTSTISPQTALFWQYISLYGLIFLFVFGTSTLGGYFLRTLFFKTQIRYEFLKTARRQGVWFGLLTVAYLVLQVSRILNLRTAILLIIVFLLIELYAQ